MSIIDRLNEDMKQAMRNKEKDVLSVIRMLKASLQNEAIKLGASSLSEDEVLTVLARELKQRKDSLQEFKKANRDDLVASLEREIEIVQKYMPKQLSKEEIQAIVQQIIEELNANSKKDFGKVMKMAMQKMKGQADGNIVKEVVQHLLD